MTAPATTRPVGVDELRRAWIAVQAGDFRHPTHRTHPRQPTQPALPQRSAAEVGTAQVWAPAPGEVVVPVVGATGSCGATTLSLALATAAGRVARVVECASASTSGLVAASSTELGTDDHGWVHGARDGVRLARAEGTHRLPDRVPAPPPADTPLVSVVDIGSQVEQVVTGEGWLTRLLTDAPAVVLVTRATVPGLRRLECCLHLIGPDRALVAVLGPPRRRWPRPVADSAGPLTTAVIDAGRLVDIPEDHRLAIHGLTPDPLPAPLLAKAAALLPLIEGTTHHDR